MPVDLRSTSCTWDREKIPPSFFPAVEKRLYHPTRPLKALSLLLNSQDVIPSSDSGVLHVDHLTHSSRERSRDFGNSPNLDTSPCSPEQAPSLQGSFLLHPPDELQRSYTELGVATLDVLHDVVGAESDAYAVRHKAKLFYSQRTTSTSSSIAHPPRHMPQWGQELLMLYRDPPPWDQAQIPLSVKVPSRPRSLEDLVSVDRTNERTMKGLQEMQDLLSKRHRSMKQTDGSYYSVKASTKLPASRIPFAIRSGEPSAPVHDRANEEPSTPRYAGTAAKSTTVKPKSSQSLRPITDLPIPMPPDSSRPVSENKGQDSGSAPCGQRRCHASNRDSLQIEGLREQSTDLSLGCTIRRSGTDRVGPAVARKRTRIAVSVSGSKRQEHGTKASIRGDKCTVSTIAPG